MAVLLTCHTCVARIPHHLNVNADAGSSGPGSSAASSRTGLASAAEVFGRGQVGSHAHWEPANNPLQHDVKHGRLAYLGPTEEASWGCAGCIGVQ